MVVLVMDYAAFWVIKNHLVDGLWWRWS